MNHHRLGTLVALIPTPKFYWVCRLHAAPPPPQTMDSLPMTIMAMGIAMTSPMAMVQPTAKQ